jgi:hypothetical protein
MSGTGDTTDRCEDLTRRCCLNVEATEDRSRRRGSRQSGVCGEQHESGNESSPDQECVKKDGATQPESQRSHHSMIAKSDCQKAY